MRSYNASALMFLDLDYIGKKDKRNWGVYIIGTSDHPQKMASLRGRKGRWAGSSKGDLLNNAIQCKVGKGVKIPELEDISFMDGP